MRRTALCLSTTQKAKLKFLTLIHLIQARALHHSLSSPPTQTHAPTTSSEQVRWEQLSKIFFSNYSDWLGEMKKSVASQKTPHTHEDSSDWCVCSSCLIWLVWVCICGCLQGTDGSASWSSGANSPCTLHLIARTTLTQLRSPLLPSPSKQNPK